MIQELVKNGYQSDPVKVWKQLQVTKGNMVSRMLLKKQIALFV